MQRPAGPQAPPLHGENTLWVRRLSHRTDTENKRQTEYLHALAQAAGNGRLRVALPPPSPQKV